MSAIAPTPEPPYYAVIAPAVIAAGADLAAYRETAARMIELARGIDGFLGIEFGFQADFALAVSYWRSLEAIETWRRHAEHARAKARGRGEWFAAYATRIARVERAY